MHGKRASENTGFILGALILWLAIQSSFANPDPDLAGPVWANGQFQFMLNGAEGIPYVIESSPDLMSWVPVVTNGDFSDVRRINLAAPDGAHFYRSVRAFGPFPAAVALAAVGNIYLNGYGIITDSYNSHDTNLSTGGQYDPSKTSTNGNVASESGVVNLFDHTMFGNLYLGSTASNTVNGFVTGTIHTNYNIQFPDVVLPSGASGWPIATLTSSNITGELKSVMYYDFTNSGNYTFTNGGYPMYVEAGVTLNLNVTSATFNPASLQIHGGTTNSGSVCFFLNGPSFATITPNTAADASNQPQNLEYFGTSKLNAILLSTGANLFVGVVYAPEAAFTLDGGGGAGGGMLGSVIVNSIVMNGHWAFHYDEYLMNFWPNF